MSISCLILILNYNFPSLNLLTAFFLLIIWIFLKIILSRRQRLTFTASLFLFPEYLSASVVFMLHCLIASVLCSVVRFSVGCFNPHRWLSLLCVVGLRCLFVTPVFFFRLLLSRLKQLVRVRPRRNSFLVNTDWLTFSLTHHFWQVLLH